MGIAICKWIFCMTLYFYSCQIQKTNMSDISLFSNVFFQKFALLILWSFRVFWLDRFVRCTRKKIIILWSWHHQARSVGEVQRGAIFAGAFQVEHNPDDACSWFQEISGVLRVAIILLRLLHLCFFPRSIHHQKWTNRKLKNLSSECTNRQVS